MARPALLRVDATDPEAEPALASRDGELVSRLGLSQQCGIRCPASVGIINAHLSCLRLLCSSWAQCLSHAQKIDQATFWTASS